MKAAAQTRARDNIDERIKVNVSKQREVKTWPSETTVFLKHADRDPNGFLSPDGLDNQKMLVPTCSCIYWIDASDDARNYSLRRILVCHERSSK